MRRIGKATRRPPGVRPRDREGGLPRLSDGVARASRCPASPRHALLAENLGKPSLWVNIMELWYELTKKKARPYRVLLRTNGYTDPSLGPIGRSFAPIPSIHTKGP